MERVEIEDVEPTHDDSIEEHGPHALEGTDAPHEGDHPSRPVGSIDADPRRAHGLDVLRERHDDGGERCVPVAAVERPVIDAHYLGMRFPERPPQR